jgi:hypothetical protein
MAKFNKKEQLKEAKFYQGEIETFEIPDRSNLTVDADKDDIMKKIYLYNKIRILNKYILNNLEVQKNIFDKLAE